MESPPTRNYMKRSEISEDCESGFNVHNISTCMSCDFFVYLRMVLPLGIDKLWNITKKALNQI